MFSAFALSVVALFHQAFNILVGREIIKQLATAFDIKNPKVKSGCVLC